MPGRPPHPARRQRSSKTGAMPTCIAWCAHTHHARTVWGGLVPSPLLSQEGDVCEACHGASVAKSQACATRVRHVHIAIPDAMHQSKIQRFPRRLGALSVIKLAGLGKQHGLVSHAGSSSSQAQQANRAQEAASMHNLCLQPSFRLPCQNPEPWVCVLNRPQRGYTFRKKP